MEITVGMLRKQLEIFGDDWIIDFSGLDFSRVKPRGEKLVQIEFGQILYRDKSGTWVVEDCE